MTTSNHIMSFSNRLRTAFIFAGLSGLVACSWSDLELRPISGDYQSFGTAPANSSPIAAPLPWVMWAARRDLNGQMLTNVSVIQGDEFAAAGDYQRALTEYTRARSQTLPAGERDALAVRIASTYLALDQVDDSLKSLSDHARGQSKQVETIDPFTGLIFAYGYGRKGDIDQSLAWFSRVSQQSTGRDGARNMAEQGVRSLFRTLPEDAFAKIEPTWSQDSFIRAMLGQEARNRAQRGYAAAQNAGIGIRFWETTPNDFAAIKTSVRGVTSGDTLHVAAVLPLSGQYGGLGKSIRQGVELALAARGAGAPLQVNFIDSAGNPTQAVAELRRLMVEGQVQAILGPLLSDEATQVSDLARQEHLPMLTFSKRSDFVTGDGIFRLGPTIEGQIDSLLDVARRTGTLNRILVVGSTDSASQQTVQAAIPRLKNYGLTVMQTIAYPKNDETALGRVAAEIETAQPDAVLFVDGLSDLARLREEIPPATRGHINFLGLGNWDNTNELARAPAIYEGIIFVSPFFAQSGRPAVVSFNESYHGQNGRDPDFLAAQAFDATTLLLAAADRRGAYGDDLATALTGVDGYEGLTGSIRVESQGELRRAYSVVQVKDGKLSELMAMASPTFVFRGNESVAPTISQDTDRPRDPQLMREILDKDSHG